MMKLSLALFFALITAHSVAGAAMPAITGTPVIDKAPLLEWPRDNGFGAPDLTEATANQINDLHGDIGACNEISIVLSTAGNYHMALREMWYNQFLPRYGSEIKSWYYSTSPPIAADQIYNLKLAFGNITLRCKPQVAVGPVAYITNLKNLGLTSGPVVPIFRNRGNVILVKKGNPRNIRNIWDLGRPDVSVVTPHPTFEKSTFENYSQTIYNVAVNNPQMPSGWTPERLINEIFNGANDRSANHKHSSHHNRHEHDHIKWLSGARIHHRELPWSIAYGKGDAGVIFYHIALHAVRTFPDLFEIIPLGGTVEDPQPLTGNRIGGHNAVRVKGDWNAAQLSATEMLMQELESEEFRSILEKHGLARP